MPSLAKCWPLLMVVLAVRGAPLAAQEPAVGDPPRLLVPARAPSAADRARREARKLFGLALLYQREDRILEAIRALEEAVRLDPEAAALYRALAPLYLALSRDDDGLAATRKVVELDPADHETWFFLSRQLRERNQVPEAIAALTRAAQCPQVKEHVELYLQIHFDLGALYEESRNFAQAERAYREVARTLEKTELLLESLPYTREQLQAEAARTCERLGRVCLQAGHFDRAEAAFRRAQELDPTQAGRLNYHLAEVCQAQGKMEAALRYLDAHLRTQPPGAEAYELRIKLLEKLGRRAEVVPSLVQFADQDPHNVPLQLLTAQQLGRDRRWAEAEARYQRLAADNPTPLIYQGLFRLYLDQGHVDKVLDQFDRTIGMATQEAGAEPAAQPRESAAVAAVRARAMLAVLRTEPALVNALVRQATDELKRQRERHPETRRFLAVLAARTKQLDAAEALYRDCLRPSLPPATEAEVYAGLLDVLWEARKHAQIVTLCRDALRPNQTRATNHVMFHVNLAHALVALGRAEEALAAANKAVELADERNRLRLRRTRAAILAQVDRHDEAVAECRALLKEYREPGEVRDIRYTLANVYSQARQFAAAEEQLRRILDIDPNDATVNNDLGYILADQGKQLDEAERLIRKAIELDVQQKKEGKRLEADDDSVEANPAYLDSLGWVLFRQGQLEPARQWLEKAANLPGGDDPVIWDHLGDLYMKLDQPDRARAAWKKALDLYEIDKRRRPDQHYHDLKNKLKLIQPR